MSECASACQRLIPTARRCSRMPVCKRTARPARLANDWLQPSPSLTASTCSGPGESNGATAFGRTPKRAARPAPALDLASGEKRVKVPKRPIWSACEPQLPCWSNGAESEPDPTVALLSASRRGQAPPIFVIGSTSPAATRQTLASHAPALRTQRKGCVGNMRVNSAQVLR